MASFKYNPFTGNFDIVDNNELQSVGTVWVDNVYGNDTTGVVERRDKPFATINAAWTAMGSNVRRNNCIFRISRGNHTLTADLDDAAWGNASREITFVCEGSPRQTSINQPLAARIFHINGSGGTNRTLNIYGGTWNRTGITSTQMFDTTSTDTNELFIIGANINDSGGTSGIAFQRSTQLIEDCLINCTNNAVVLIGSGANSSQLKIRNSSISAPVASSFFSSNTIREFSIEDSLIDIPTGIIATANGNVRAEFKNSIVNHSGVALDGRALGLTVDNSAFVSITNQGQFIFDTVTGLNFLIADGMYLQRPDTATQACIRRSGPGMVPAYIYGRGLYYSERTPPTSGSDPSTTNSGPNGRVGFIMPTATIGNVVTINLPNAAATITGTPYNTAPIVYNVATTNTLTELTAMKAAVDAQVTTPGTPWNIWCQGDTSLVRVNPGGTQLWIIMHPFAPGYINISTAVNYTTDTLGDITNDSNLSADGIVDRIGGPQYPLIDTPRRNGNVDYPETFLRPLLNLRTL